MSASSTYDGQMMIETLTLVQIQPYLFAQSL